MKQIELYVPFTDESTLSGGHWGWLQKTVLDFFGGYSAYSIDGQRRSPETGQNIADQCQVYRIVTDLPDEQLKDCIKFIALGIRLWWTQETVLYIVSDVDAVFV